MKLSRLTLHGFKSFADRTELRFHDGVTAIVGPNGCGKSNISDAIRWVLGEQRASAIRGSKMEEAIFQGTSERRAVARAEVSLVLTNEEGRLAVPQREVDIRRTVFREGGSDYEMNRQGCRLRDIQDLLRDTGLGANSYAVIEQGMVDAILSERAEDRRHMFEEAAGIGRYKDRRKAAQRRLEQAEGDLSRLDDLITEVDSKVKNLARQRRRALRYKELRARRLALEVALATADLEAIAAELAAAEKRLTEISREEPALRAELSTQEATLEKRRLEAAGAMHARNGAASELEEINRRISERERELAVTDERHAHAVQRRQQIAVERGDLTVRRQELERELARLGEERTQEAERVAELAEQARTIHERQTALREELTELRGREEQARAKEKELAQRLSRLEAEAAGAEARAAETDARLERLDAEQEEVVREISRLDEQGDLFAERSRELGSRVGELQEQAAAAAERLQALRAGEADARRRLSEAEDIAESLAAKVSALDTLEREYHGFAPAVAAALANRDELHGLLGPLAEFLHLPKRQAAALEGAIGSLLQMLVVSDEAAADDVRRWLDAHGEDVVAVLPHDALPRVEALVEAVRFAGNVPSEPVILGRRERLGQLRQELDDAAGQRDALAVERTALALEAEQADEAAQEARAALHAAQLELQRIDADEAARAGQRARIEGMRREMEERREELRAAVEAARAQALAAREQRTGLEQELATHRDEWERASDDVARRDSAWESVRDEEAELRVVHARAEGHVDELARRQDEAARGIDQIGQRLEALDREEKEHEQALGQLEGVRGETGTRLEELFRGRDEVAARLRALDEQLDQAAETTERIETEARALRRTLEERSEERHALELRRSEASARDRGIKERLEAEWARPFPQLVRQAAELEGEAAELPEGGPEVLRAELTALAADIERLGPINMLAVEEFEEESKRLEFLSAQREDLIKARDDLLSAIRQINRTARALFEETFEAVRANFQRTFGTLFEGGTCDLWLADAEDPLESPIEISASPKGKRTQRIHLLSGGERALTALALMFAIYLVKPSPFCVLDEVDAPLDEANIARFLSMLEEFKRETQFIVITHNTRTMGAADWIYGVTMEEAGVSSIVGVKVEGQVVAA